MKTDYSQYLDEARLEIEEKLWIEQGRHAIYADAISQSPPTGKIPLVLEVGCGTGIVATHLNWRVHYVGIDANRLCLNKARAKNNAININERRLFIECDVRVFKAFRQFDIVAAFAFFKHFMPDEWEKIFLRVLSFAPYAVFTVAMAERTVENGTDGFPHTLVSRATLDKALAKAGRKIIFIMDEQTVEPIFCVGPIPSPTNHTNPHE